MALRYRVARLTCGECGREIAVPEPFPEILRCANCGADVITREENAERDKFFAAYWRIHAELCGEPHFCNWECSHRVEIERRMNTEGQRK